MKKLLTLIILVALALSGCASGKILGFLASTDYVDAKAKTLADQQAAEIEKLKGQIAENAAALDAAKTAVDKMNKVEKTVTDLEDKIGAMPKDVIKQIVDILQSALN